MDITDRSQASVLLVPESGVGLFYAYSGLFALLQYQHIPMYHFLHFLCVFTAVSIYFFSFSSTSEFQVLSKLIDLSANKVSGTGYRIPSTTEFSP